MSPEPGTVLISLRAVLDAARGAVALRNVGAACNGAEPCRACEGGHVFAADELLPLALALGGLDQAELLHVLETALDVQAERDSLRVAVASLERKVDEAHEVVRPKRRRRPTTTGSKGGAS